MAARSHWYGMAPSVESPGQSDAIDALAASLKPPRHAIAANLAAAAVLGGVVVAALSGALGGAPPETRWVRTSDISVGLTAPERLRTGMVGEISLTLLPARDMPRPAVDIPSDWLRGVTINETSPAPEREEGLPGATRLHLAPLKARQPVTLSFSYQVNPDRRGRSTGAIRVLDGEQVQAVVPVELLVLP